jgi:hypothetical protein
MRSHPRVRSSKNVAALVSCECTPSHALWSIRKFSRKLCEKMHSLARLERRELRQQRVRLGEHVDALNAHGLDICSAPCAQ